MKQLLVFVMMTMLPLSHASAGTWFEVERSIEERVGRLVHYVDRDALVVVKGSLKEGSYNLPGVTGQEIDLYSFGYLSEFDPHNLKTLSITVYTSKESLPKWIEQEIKKIGQITGVETKVKVMKRDADARDSDLREQANATLERAEKGFAKFSENFHLAVLGAALFFLVLMFSFVFLLAQIFKSNVKTQLKGLRDIQDELGNSRGSLPPSVGDHTARVASEVSRFEAESESFSNESAALIESLRNLPDNGVMSLVSDAYWSRNDSYAAWVWTHLSSVQKKKIVQSWIHGFNYAQYLSSISGKPASFHLHPSYESSHMSLIDVSNEDLSKFIQKRPEAWFSLSPMRSESLVLDIQTRLKLLDLESQRGAQVQSVGLDDKALLLKSPPRVLKQSWRKIELTLADESELSKVVGKITPEQRSQFPSWIWLDQYEDQFCQSLLADYSAQDLATSWVGPESTMKRLLLLVPERKQKMLVQLCQIVEPRRLSPCLLSVMERLLHEELKPVSTEVRGAA